jgi:hypothetical protein
MGINNIPAFADNLPVLIYIPALEPFQKKKSFIIINIPALFFDFFEVVWVPALTFPTFLRSGAFSQSTRSAKLA